MGEGGGWEVERVGGGRWMWRGEGFYVYCYQTTHIEKSSRGQKSISDTDRT